MCSLYLLPDIFSVRQTSIAPRENQQPKLTLSAVPPHVSADLNEYSAVCHNTSLIDERTTIAGHAFVKIELFVMFLVQTVLLMLRFLLLFCRTEAHTHRHDDDASGSGYGECAEEAKVEGKEGAALSSANHGHSHGHNEHAHEGQEYDPDCAECNGEGHAHGHGHVRKTDRRVMQSTR